MPSRPCTDIRRGAARVGAAGAFMERVDHFRDYPTLRVNSYRKRNGEVTVVLYGLPAHLEPEVQAIAEGRQPPE